MKRLRTIIITLLISVCVVEIILRMFGFVPHQLNIKVPANGSKTHFDFSDSLGYCLNPDTFHSQVGLQQVTFTHLDSGRRKTFKSRVEKLPEIWFMGCSYTYGYNLDDKETYPYLIDSAINKYHFINMGCPGDGTLHQYLRLKKHLSKTTNFPSAVIVNYVAFSNPRNCMNPIYKQTLRDAYYALRESRFYDKVKNKTFCKFPFINPKDTMGIVSYMSLNSIMGSEFPLIRHSAFANTINNSINNFLSNPDKEKEISFGILKQISNLCKKNNINYFVSYLEPQGTNSNLLTYCRANQISTINLSINFEDKNLFNIPGDSFHPNANANRIIMRKFLDFMNNSKLN